MLGKNRRWQMFLGELKKRGVEIGILWQAKRNVMDPHCTVHFVQFIGRGFMPAIRGAIVIDYGPNSGFGLYVESREIGGGSIIDDAAIIAGPNARATA